MGKTSVQIEKKKVPSSTCSLSEGRVLRLLYLAKVSRGRLHEPEEYKIMDMEFREWSVDTAVFFIKSLAYKHKYRVIKLR